MANEFWYCVSLSLTHPTLDPQAVSQEITHLTPRICSMAGSIRNGKDGLPIVPEQRSILTHWLADLHADKKLFSGVTPLADFIADQLSALKDHQPTFWRWRQGGHVAFRVGWFAVTSCSAAVLDAEMIRQCGEIGIDIELNCYAPEPAYDAAFGFFPLFESHARTVAGISEYTSTQRDLLNQLSDCNQCFLEDLSGPRGMASKLKALQLIEAGHAFAVAINLSQDAVTKLREALKTWVDLYLLE